MKDTSARETAEPPERPVRAVPAAAAARDPADNVALVAA